MGKIVRFDTASCITDLDSDFLVIPFCSDGDGSAAILHSVLGIGQQIQDYLLNLVNNSMNFR